MTTQEINKNIGEYLDSTLYENQKIGVILAFQNGWKAMDIAEYVLNSGKSYEKKELFTWIEYQKDFLKICFWFSTSVYTFHEKPRVSKAFQDLITLLIEEINQITIK